MDEYLILVLTCGVTALTYLLLGFLIGVKQQYHLINGVDFSKTKDISGFCKFLGNGFLISGVLIGLSGIAIHLFDMNLLVFSIFFVTFCSIPIVNFFQAKTKYSSTD